MANTGRTHFKKGHISWNKGTAKLEKRTCVGCKNIFKTRTWKPNKYCSRECYNKNHVVTKECRERMSKIAKKRGFGKWSKDWLKEKNPNWKGGRWLTTQGYVEKWNGKNKRRLEHRLVMEKHLGRKLNKAEIVHHINGDRADNRIENLKLMEWGDHTSKHCRKTYIGQDEKECSKCGKIKKFLEFSPSKKLKCGYSSWCKKCCSKKVMELYYRTKAQVAKEFDLDRSTALETADTDLSTLDVK